MSPEETTLQKLIEFLAAYTAALQERTTPPAVAPSTPAPLAEAGPAPEPAVKRGRKPVAPAVPAAPPAEAPTVQDLRAAAQAVLDANGNDPAPIAAINREYGVKRVSELPADKYAEVIARLKKLATPAAPSS